MAGYKPVPIGIEDFKTIIDKGCYYVDKTDMIKEILDGNAMVSLFTRPRRFGKTLNISMLQRFFEKTAHSNSYLFKDLQISREGEKYMTYQGQYPVISLSLKSMKQPNFEYAFSEFKNLICSEFVRHKEILKSENVEGSYKKRYKDIFDNVAQDKEYISAIRLLSDCLYAHYHKKVIILIDEYDVPLETSHFKGFYNDMVDLVCSVFEGALKTNPYLEFGILTGCLRISKESIFTGLNNLKIYAITDHLFSQYFGFTVDEVKKIAVDFGIQDKFSEMKEWYDGYRFGETEIYNPWSILNYVLSAISEKNLLPKSYWSNTSSNDIIHELITNGNEETHKHIEALINGEGITKPIYEDITYRNININTDYIWSFLLFTGYLKPIAMRMENDMIYADMMIPNKEVGSIYRTTIREWFNEKVLDTSRDDLFAALISGDVSTFEALLADWLDETISYYDNRENYYHGFVSGVLKGFKGYDVKSNRESGDGRPDLLLLERKRHELAVIIEIKIAGSFRELDTKCDEALCQIKEMRYEADLRNDCYEKVLKYGIAFCGKTCRVKLGED